MIEDNGNHLLVPIAAKWLASGTDADDDDSQLTNEGPIATKLPHCRMYMYYSTVATNQLVSDVQRMNDVIMSTEAVHAKRTDSYYHG